MLKVYGNNCLNSLNVYKPIEHLKSGRVSVSDEQRCGRPVEVATSSLEHPIGALIRDNRITIELIAKKVHVSVVTVHNVIPNKLQYKKSCARWVPKRIDNHKETTLQICYHWKKETFNFKRSIFLEDHHFEQESKRQNLEWKYAGSPAWKKLKSQPSAGKVVLTRAGQYH